MACNAGPDIIEDGLVLCLDAANINSYPKSGTTWSDLAGSNDGTLQNMEDNFSNDNGGSLSFDGADEYVDISDNGFLDKLSYSDKVTVCVWIKFTGTLSQEEILSFKPFNVNALRVYIYPSNGVNKIILNASGAGYNVSFSSSDGVTTDKWYFICATLDSTFELYVNGEPWSGTTGGSGSIPNTNFEYSDAQYIGKFVQGPGAELNGKLSSVMFYERVLSANEIRQNYQATLGRFT